MNILFYILLGLVAGIFGGFFGIGGGAIMIPALVYIMGFSQHMSQGTTLAAMIPPIGLLAAMRYWQNGDVKIQVALFICLGFFFGGWIGADFAQRIPDILLKRLFGVFLFILSLRMMLAKG